MPAFAAAPPGAAPAAAVEGVLPSAVVASGLVAFAAP